MPIPRTSFTNNNLKVLDAIDYLKQQITNMGCSVCAYVCICQKGTCILPCDINDIKNDDLWREWFLGLTQRHHTIDQAVAKFIHMYYTCKKISAIGAIFYDDDSEQAYFLAVNHF